MTTYIFPGQGSQARGMGRLLFSEFPEVVQQADRILGYSIEKLCLEDAAGQLNITNYTQPALYVVNALHYLKKIRETNVIPGYVVGHSLGEYSALFAANVYDFSTGLHLVKKRGELMSRAEGGSMAAVIGLTADAVKAVLENNMITNLSIANYNSYTQLVITGPKEAIYAAEADFISAGASGYIPLRVGGAFHSSYMNEARNEFAEFIKQFSFSSPRMTVVANISAKPYDANQIANYLIDQITHPVLWRQSIEYLLSHNESEFIEIGPGRILTGLVTRIVKNE